MAAMLKREDEEKWLNPDIVEAERLLPLWVPILLILWKSMLLVLM